MNSTLMTSTEAASYLRVARQTLAVWRLNGRGPAYVKLNRKIAYDKTVLDTFIASHTHASTTEY